MGVVQRSAGVQPEFVFPTEEEEREAALLREGVTRAMAIAAQPLEFGHPGDWVDIRFDDGPLVGMTCKAQLQGDRMPPEFYSIYETEDSTGKIYILSEPNSVPEGVFRPNFMESN